jgi:hypothetical protein
MQNKIKNSTNLKNARKYSLLLFLLIISFLFIYSKIFKPKPPIQNSLIKSLDKEELIKNLAWYSNNLIGSFNLPFDEVCTIYKTAEKVTFQENCKIFNYKNREIEIYEKLINLFKEKSNFPFIWISNYSNINQNSSTEISISLFRIKPIKIHALKKNPYPLGSIYETLPSFKRLGFSPLIESVINSDKELIEKKVLEEMKAKLEQEYQHAIYIKAHPMGYYLDVPALPVY